MSLRKRLPRRHISGRQRRSASPLLENLENRLVLSDLAASIAAIPPFEIQEIAGPNGQPIPDASAGPSGYSPQQLQEAYGVNQITFGSVKATGVGETIALIDAYNDPSFADTGTSGYVGSALYNFDKQFGLPDPPSFTIYNENGGTTDLPGADVVGGWGIEESLDIEWAHAMAPDANIDVVVCASPNFSDLLLGAETAATTLGAAVVSMSFGADLEHLDSGSYEQTLDDRYLAPALAANPNVTFLASTGDNGADASKAGKNGPAPLYPSVSPLVVAVGGTTLTVGGSSGNYTWVGETGWSYTSDSFCPTCASGGGISTEYSAPSYQSDNGIDLGNGFRTVPDVSADADPSTGVSVYDPYDFGSSTPWETVGGTSLASPTWAGFIAIADQGRGVLYNQPALNGPDQTLPELYALGGTSDSPANYNEYFHDITVGNNGNSAGTGYDLVTGIGSPIANNLLPALAAADVSDVTTLADSDTSGFTTLRQALANAATLGGSQTVTFAPGLAGTITLSSGLVISSDVSIDGPGAAAISVSGGGPSSNFTVFTVNSGVTASISGLDIADGNTSGNGGGILSNGILTLSSDTLSGNSAASGGGIDNTGTLTLTNDTFSGNSAISGGGIDNTGTATLSDDTIAGNSAGDGGGIFNSGTATLNDTIVADSIGGGDISGSLGGNNNLIDDAASAGGLTNGNDGNIVGVNPLLAPLGEYGGPTPTLALLPGSPAIDAGEVLSGISTDQRGAPRPSSGAVDIGAFQDQGYTLAVASGSGQDAAVGSAFANPLVATLTENFANAAIPGVSLSFNAPASGASASLSAGSGITNASGQVSITAVANNTAGSFNVTASSTGVASTADFSMNNTGEPAFSDLAGPTIVYGTATVTLSGTILTGSTPPPGDVTITLDGTAQSASIANNGSFSSVFNTASLGVNGSPYTITYAYAANGDFLANTNTSETLTVTPAPLTATIIGDPTKIYNGTTAATLASSNFSLSGLVTGQSFTVTQTAGTYNSPNAGSATTVTASLVAGNFTAGSGTLASNYTFPATASGAGAITPETLTASIIGDPTKTYNGNTSATLTSGNFSLSGLIGSQSFTVTQTSGTYNSKDVATATTVTASLSPGTITAASGTLASNYNLPTTASGAGQITPASLTVSGITAANKVYNASTAATLNTTSATLMGAISGDTVNLNTGGATGTFASRNVGTGITVTVADLTLSGAQAGDYIPIEPTTMANITPAGLTVSGITAANKVYNDSTGAILDTIGATLVGVFSGDTVNLNASGATGTFAAVNVGTGITVTVSGLTISGAEADDYTLTQPTTTANITPASLTVTGITAGNKVYNAAVAAALNTTDVTLVGVFSGDTVNLNASGATGTFASANVGTGITVTVSGLTISGAEAGDYTLTQPTTTANITPASLTVTGITAANKVYNANASAALNTTDATLSGVFSGDTVTLGTSGATGIFASQNVGTGITVAVTDLTISGAEAGDYTLTEPTTTANITPAGLTVTSISGANKVYNASTGATLDTIGATLVGVFSGDTVNLSTSGAIGTFASQNVGTGITVTVSGLTIGGAQADDYTLTQPTTTANITPAGLTVTGITAANKVYNANASAALNNTTDATLVGVFIGDTVNLSTSGATGTFASQNVGTGITVTVAGLTISGAQVGDYTLTQPTTTANITPAGLTVSGITASNMVYDASTTAALNTSSAALLGVFSGDTVNLGTSVATGNFTSASVGTGIVVIVSGLTISGPQSGDYTLTGPTTTANINPATPRVRVTDVGGTYNGSAFPASASIIGVSGEAGSSLEGIVPSAVYYLGTTAAGTPLSRAPIDSGTYTVVAEFPGSADYVATQSDPASFTISKGTPTLALAPLSGSAVFGQALTLVATVVAPGGPPTGTVTFSDDGTVLGTVALDGSGTAMLTTNALPVGGHSITATYSGDPSLVAALSGSASTSVAPSGTSVVLVPHPVLKKKKVKSEVLTAEIEPAAPGGGVPTGMVTFELITKKKKKIKTSVLATAAISGGDATLTFKPQKVLGKVITVLYSGDTNFRASTFTAPKLSKKGLL
jgi:trimeric autotransporter adhesin